MSKKFFERPHEMVHDTFIDLTVILIVNANTILVKFWFQSSFFCIFYWYFCCQINFHMCLGFVLIIIKRLKVNSDLDREQKNYRYSILSSFSNLSNFAELVQFFHVHKINLFLSTSKKYILRKLNLSKNRIWYRTPSVSAPAYY